MSLILAITIGILITVAILQLLQRDAVRVVVGLYIFWNAANLFIIAVGKAHAARAPVAGIGEGQMADPLVQAMVLTAIVITFGFTAFLVTLIYWLGHSGKSVDIDDFREGRE